MEKSRAIELLEHLAWDRDIERNPYGDALNMAIEALKAQLSQEGTTSDTISRQKVLSALLDAVKKVGILDAEDIKAVFDMLPPAQPETLTDKEQRIFLAAIGREEKVCRQVDDECGDCRDSDSLVRTCHEITRKVKGALWT